MRRLSVAIAAALAGVVLASCSRTQNPTPVCTFAIAPASHAVEADGGTRSVSVTASADTCAWIAAPSAAWITIAGNPAGTGSASFDYAVAANASMDARSGTISVGGQMHSVTQAGRPVPPPVCTYTIDPATVTVPGAGGTGAIQVRAPAGCAWTATPTDGWIEVTAGSTGSGDGTVNYRADANPGLDSRDGRIGIADQTFLLHQDGVDVSTCSYAVAPVAFSPCMPAGSVTAHVDTASHCPWTAVSRDGWLTVDGSAARSGSGTVVLTFGSNYAAPREGLVEVRWPTPSAGQNVRVAQAGCVYATTTSSVAVGAAGGNFSVGVLQQAVPNTCGGPLQDACVWTATSSASWVVITTPMPRQGDQNVAFTVAANTSPQARQATITVQDRVVTIQQAGQP